MNSDTGFSPWDFTACFPFPACVVNEQLDVIAASKPMFSVFGIRCLSLPQKADMEKLTQAFLSDKRLAALVGAAGLRLSGAGQVERFAWDNQARSYEVTMSALPGPVRHLVVFEDDTERVAMERDTVRARSYIESVLSNLPLGIVVTDREMRVTNVNRAQESFLADMGLKIPMLQAVGMNILEIFPGEAGELGGLMRDVLEKGAVYSGIVERFAAEKGERVFSVSFAPLRGESEQIAGLIRISQDITEAERMASELRRAEIKASEVETIRKLIVTLKHEINNALTAIIGNAELLRTLDAAMPPERSAMVEEIVGYAEKIADIMVRLESVKQVKTVPYLHDGTQMIDARASGDFDPKSAGA